MVWITRLYIGSALPAGTGFGGVVACSFTPKAQGAFKICSEHVHLASLTVKPPSDACYFDAAGRGPCDTKACQRDPDGAECQLQMSAAEASGTQSIQTSALLPRSWPCQGCHPVASTIGLLTVLSKIKRLEKQDLI